MQLLDRIKANWLLVLIVVIGGVLRFAGIGFGLPYTYAADEPTRWGVALHMVQTGDLDPHWLGYPHLAFYFNAIALFLYFAAGRIAGEFRTPLDILAPEVVTIGVGRLAMPSEFLVARGVTALLGTGAVVLVYLIGCQLTGRKSVGLLSAFAFAVSPAAVAHSQMVSLDTFGLFFLLLATYWIMPLVHDFRLRQYALAGIGVGLAFSGKYNVGIIGISLALALFLNFRWRGLLRRELYVSGAACLVAFAIVNPYSILDLNGFFHGLTMASDSQSQSVGAYGNGTWWYLSYLWSVEGVGVALAVVQAVRFLIAAPKRALVFLAFPVSYFLFVSQFPVRNDRTILPVIPMLDILAAWLILCLYDWISARYKMHRPMIAAGLLAGCALLVGPPLQTSIAGDLRSVQVDGRETARAWIDANMPAGTRIAEEGYSPYIDTDRFVVQGFVNIVEHTPEWYHQNGFEYLVVSQGMYERFFAEPDRYRLWVDKYNQFFDQLRQMKRFDDNGYEIRIYETAVSLPAHRVAARFGDYGDLIELVGYDESAQKWTEGQPLVVTIYWRPLRDQQEPLELDLRLIGDGGREVGHVHGDLLQGRGWQTGMFATEWEVPVSGNAGPGPYKLAVNLLQTRYGYAPPAKAWNGVDIDPLQLGPFVSRPIPISSAELNGARASDLSWSNQIALIGYSTPAGAVHGGDDLPLTFYWKSISAPLTGYTFFVHLVDEHGNTIAQLDGAPGRGNYPTSLWQAGETLRDDYWLHVPPDAVPGTYALEIGWYELPGLERLPITSPARQAGSDHVVLPNPVTVIPR